MSRFVDIHGNDIDPDHVIALVKRSSDVMASVGWELLMDTGDRIPASDFVYDYEESQQLRADILDALAGR